MGVLDRETGIRAATGVVFVAVLLGAVWAHELSNAALWFVVATGAFVEWHRHAGAVSVGAKVARLLVALVWGAGLASLPLAQSGTCGPGAVALFLAMIWTNDTMAYVWGRLLGRHKLMPAVSPGKTWEGFAGGVLTAGAMTWALTGSLAAGAAGILAGALATAGDLTQSAWKRRRNLKDSGQILPGHGGFLDRFDGFLYAVPCYVLLVWRFPTVFCEWF